MTSDAAVMSKPVCRGMPSSRAPRPATMLRSARSLTSRTRRQVTLAGSIPSALPWNRWLSIIAASRLCAAVTAWKSPVRCRLTVSNGTTWLYPPPAAPPLMPNVGPIDAWDRDGGALADARKRLSQAYRRGRLALAERRGCDARHDHVLGPGARREMLDRPELDLRRMVAVQFEPFAGEPHGLGDVGHRFEPRAPRDLQGGRDLRGHRAPRRWGACPMEPALS